MMTNLFFVGVVTIYAQIGDAGLSVLEDDVLELLDVPAVFGKNLEAVG